MDIPSPDETDRRTKLRVTCHQDVVFLRLAGRSRRNPAWSVRDQLAPALDHSGHVVLDLQNTSVDTDVLGVLFSFQRRLELKERRLLLVTTDPRFFHLLERAGVANALTVFADAEAAFQFAQTLEEVAHAA